VANNVAETPTLTFDGIRLVIDAGLARVRPRSIRGAASTRC
jgi:HrpA-like RNA helicase